MCPLRILSLYSRDCSHRPRASPRSDKQCSDIGKNRSSYRADHGFSGNHVKVDDEPVLTGAVEIGLRYPESSLGFYPESIEPVTLDMVGSFAQVSPFPRVVQQVVDEEGRGWRERS